MTTSHDFERQLGAWLREDSEQRVPDHLGAVLVGTIATRQRPWWSSLGRLLPMNVTATRLWAVRPASLRTVLVLGLVALIIAALVAAIVGSRRQLPPPFGLARNGALLASANGDLFTVDPTTGNDTPLIPGPTFDFGPVFSRDGTRVLFLRGAPTPCGRPDCGLILAVANADGTGLREITTGVPGLDGLDWSPDGTRIAFLSTIAGASGHVLNIVKVDGTGIITLDAGRPVNQLSWLPPGGAEILFRGEEIDANDPPAGIFAIRSDGTRVRPISTRPALSKNDFNDVAVSPDGSLVAYRVAAPGRPFEIRILDLRSKVERTLRAPSNSGTGGPVFSPDGRSIVYLRWFPDQSTQLSVAPVDDSSPGIAIGPHGPPGPDGPTIRGYGFSPDGRSVFANYDAEKVARLMPVDGTPGVVVARGDLALVTYQRLAP
jgi:hypothetical protein